MFTVCICRMLQKLSNGLTLWHSSYVMNVLINTLICQSKITSWKYQIIFNKHFNENVLCIGEAGACILFNCVEPSSYLYEVLEKIQWRFVRRVGVINCFIYHQVPVKNLSCDLGLLPLIIRRHITDLIIFYNILNG